MGYLVLVVRSDREEIFSELLSLEDAKEKAKVLTTVFKQVRIAKLVKIVSQEDVE